ncbi:MAG TPA: aminotransferase class IV [Thermodesulfobacteriota bacterium]|nr:aminotransferase class IV [Thermodesulfobacteriota bacterium]
MAEHIFIEDRPVNDAATVRTLFYGEGLFETFRYKSRMPALFESHYERMRNGAEYLGIPMYSISYIEGLIENAVAAAGIGDAYVKVCLLSDGSTLFYDLPSKSAVLTVVREYKPPSEPLALHVGSARRNSTSPLSHLKSLNYLENVLARREAVSAGFSECLFLSDKGHVAECSAANIYWIRGGILYTPSLECGALRGTTREALLQVAGDAGLDVREGRYSPDDLYECELALATNALIGVMPVSVIGHISLDTDTVHLDSLRKVLFERLGW